MRTSETMSPRHRHTYTGNTSLRKLVGKAGAANAGIFAAQIVARKDAKVNAKLVRFKKELAAGVEERDRKLQSDRQKS